jgi:hypothetical protein
MRDQVANAMKNRISSRIGKDEAHAKVTLALVWRDDGRARDAEAGTYRIAADIAGMSLGRWAIAPHANPGILGDGRLGTYIELELVDGGADEVKRARTTLRAALDQD